MNDSNSTPFLLFHPGKQHSPQTALALQDLGRLRYYATSIFYDPKKFPYLLEKLPGRVGKTLHSEFARFEHPMINASMVKTWGAYEWLERLALRVGAVRLSNHLNQIGNKRFAAGLARDIASDAHFALWGYNGSSVEAFRLAKDHGRFCVLDRTIGDYRYFNLVMAEQAESYPRFFTDQERSVDQRRIDLDDEEYDLADMIVVGSRFCGSTLLNHSKVRKLNEKINVLPYCSNNHDFDKIHINNWTPGNDRPLRFIFVGRIAPRKGVHLLLEAIARFSPLEASLTLLGKMLIPADAYAPYAGRVTHLNSVAPNEVAQIMGEHDVLILPSFFEGSAITLLEAQNCGLGIIQSEQAGTGATAESGIILPMNGVEELYEAMRVAVDNRMLVQFWKANAVKQSHHHRFQSYRQNIERLISTNWQFGAS